MHASIYNIARRAIAISIVRHFPDSTSLAQRGELTGDTLSLSISQVFLLSGPTKPFAYASLAASFSTHPAHFISLTLIGCRTGSVIILAQLAWDLHRLVGWGWETENAHRRELQSSRRVAIASKQPQPLCHRPSIT